MSMIATRDRAGLTVRDENGATVAITADEDEAGMFIEEGDAWLKSQGLRRVGAWIARHAVLEQPGRTWLGGTPATHTECDVVLLGDA